MADELVDECPRCHRVKMYRRVREDGRYEHYVTADVTLWDPVQYRPDVVNELVNCRCEEE